MHQTVENLIKIKNKINTNLIKLKNNNKTKIIAVSKLLE